MSITYCLWIACKKSPILYVQMYKQGVIMEYKFLGTKIKLYRMRMGLTQAELAEKTGLSEFMLKSI